MVTMRNRSTPPVLPVLLAALGFLWACAGGGFLGGPMDADRRVSIPDGGVREGEADAGSARVGYRIAVESTDPRSISVDARVLDLFYRADAVRIQMAFLDADGRVLHWHPVFATGYRDRSVLIRGTTLPVPDGAAAVAFAVSVQDSRGHR